MILLIKYNCLNECYKKLAYHIFLIMYTINPPVCSGAVINGD